MNEEVVAKVSSKALILHACLILCGIGLLTIWSPLAAKMATKLSHDNKYVKGKTGLLRVCTMDSPISKITSVKVDQGILGRMFNYGTISINTAGDSTDYTFAYIDNPNAFKKSLLNKMQ